MQSLDELDELKKLYTQIYAKKIQKLRQTRSSTRP